MGATVKEKPGTAGTGTGLGTCLVDSTSRQVKGQQANVSRDTIVDIPIDGIARNPHQPRQDFGGLDGLAETIKVHGLQHPITVAENGDGDYSLIAGERRLMGARMAGLATIPAIVRVGDQAILALIENIQREDLKPLEEAAALKELLDRGETQEALAGKLGVSRTYIAQKVRLLSLPSEALHLLNGDTAGLYGPISEGAARQILRLDLIDEISTAPAPKDSWANFIAHRILWHWKVRSVEDVRHAVDEVFVDLYFSMDRYGKLDPAKAQKQAEEEWLEAERDVLDQVKKGRPIGRLGFVGQIALFHSFHEPDYGKLSEAKRAEVFKAFMRWVKEYGEKHPFDSGE